MLDESEILAIVNQELSTSYYINTTVDELRASLSYYLGRPDGTEVEGRSRVTSTDVADSIEWIMPQVMKSFTQHNEIVTFDPLNEEDEHQAELESEYVYNVLMKKNNGFVILHEFIKDALMQRNGIIKVYFEELENKNTERYTGLTLDQVLLLQQQQNVEIVSAEEGFYQDYTGNVIPEYNVEVLITEKEKKIKVMSIPLEEFRVNANHNSIDLSDARFTAHVCLKSISDIREMGIPEDVLDKLTNDIIFPGAYRFELQRENYLTHDVTVDESEKLVSISECYIRIDMEENYISKLWKITCGGVLTATHILSMEEIDYDPWVSTTAILMSHKFQGLSLYDRLKEIQDQKTALLRNIFDNIYLTNNQRMGVIEGQVNLDDLLISRPGGIIRMKRQDALFPITQNQLGDQTINMVNYLDTVRAGRSGVSSEGQASPENIGDRVGSQGIDRLMNAKEELVGLMIRVIAETGIKPLCLKIRNLANKHFDAVEDFKFRGQWTKVNPTQWKKRDLVTVSVGTGSGNQAQMVQAVQNVIAIQKEVMAVPGQALLNPQRIFDTLDLYCKLSGLHGANRFFVDPKSPEGQQQAQQAAQQSQQEQQKNAALQQAQVQIEQQIVQAETIKAQAAQQKVQLEGQINSLKLQLQNTELQDKNIIEQLKHELAQNKLLLESNNKENELASKREEFVINSALKLTEIEATAKTQENENFKQNEDDIDVD